ncbi:MAG: hypothetical protein SR3Q1_04120 [Quinella sp. 3Q1]|nr:hypothetical protein [Quinella sp. 3Q1]
MIITRPLTPEQRKLLDDKSKPAQEDILAAQDALFMNLLTRVADLESSVPTAVPSPPINPDEEVTKS